MSRRDVFHDKLKEFLGSDAVYFNPPTGFKLKQYPCIVYNRSRLSTQYANNQPYLMNQAYSVTLICKSVDEGEPWYEEGSDDALFRKLLKFFPYCSHERHFVNEGLSHDVFNIYF